MKFKIRNAIVGAIIYLSFIFWMFATLGGFAVFWIFYILGCMVCFKYMVENSRARVSGQTVEFFQSNPAGFMGSLWGNFLHVFRSDKNVVSAYARNLSNALVTQLGAEELRTMVFRDIDRDLPAPEERTFLLSRTPPTPRKTKVSVLCSLDRTANMQSVYWWILVDGIVNPNVVFWKYLSSPLSVPFAVYPYFRKGHRVDSGFTTTYPGFFNSVDTTLRVREVQVLAFDTLVETLDSFGIDTSDLKQQRSNIMNLNVSGGQNSFGSVVQGAMNKVMNTKEAA